MKQLQTLLIDRIQLILAEEVNKSTDIQKFIEKASVRLLELIQDECAYNRRSGT